jgi:NhaP-type Na+/H+ or K+/H+ antiporter
LAFGIGALISLACIRLGVPAILPLLLAGFALGRSGLGLVDSADLGLGLGAFITVAIGVLIFEGGLHLDRHELKKAPRAVWGLLTRGAIVSWGTTAVLAHFTVGMSWSIALLLGAILMVTGPTVVQPILRRVRLTPSLHSALGAEAVLIDPIGVIAAVSTLDLCLAYASGSLKGPVSGMAMQYLQPIVGGVVIGAAIGLLSRVAIVLMKRVRRIDATQLNLLAIAACTMSVGFGEWAAPEAGLVAATVCAVIMASATMSGMRDMRLFKEQISIVLVGAVFILLVSRLDLRQLLSVGLEEILFIVGVVLLVRPLSVLVGTFRSALTVRERVFAALMAPRGVVAASVASISAAALINLGTSSANGEAALSTATLVQDGTRLEQLVYLVIVVTVVLAGVIAWPLAWALRVLQGAPNGVLIVGAHALGKQLAQALKTAGIHVAIVDNNPYRMAAARDAGVSAFQGDATDLRWIDDEVMTPDIGWVIAWTGNADVDRVVSRWGAERFKPQHALLWTRQGQSESDAAVAEIGDGQPLSKIIQQIESKERRIDAWTTDQTTAKPLMLVVNGQLSLAAQANAPRKNAAKVQYIGVV